MAKLQLGFQINLDGLNRRQSHKGRELAVSDVHDHTGDHIMFAVSSSGELVKPPRHGRLAIKISCELLGCSSQLAQMEKRASGHHRARALRASASATPASTRWS